MRKQLGVDPADSADAIAQDYLGRTLRTLLGMPAGVESTVGRKITGSNTTSTFNQQMRLVFFTALVTETITKVQVPLGATNGVSNTLARVGIYSIAGNGDGTLVASTPNDTTLFTGGAGTAGVLKSLSASWSKVAGTRYAMGVLVSGGTQPTLLGGSWSGNTGLRASVGLRLSGLSATGQTDLPSTFTEASLLTTAAFFDADMTP